MASNDLTVLGIDLASDPKRTAGCVLDWNGAVATMLELRSPLSDDAAVELAGQAHLVAIDAPFGWPVAFGAAIAAHQRHEAWPNASNRELSYRATDLAVHENAGLWPLSVSTDRLGIVAFRAARLVARLRPLQPAARDGSEGIIEVYPAAALRRWNLPFRGYKGPDGRQVREAIVLGLNLVANVSDRVAPLLIESDDALDAFVAALVAIAKYEGIVDPIPASLRDTAGIEGWIWLPTGAPLSR